MALIVSYDLTAYEAALTWQIAHLPTETPPLTPETYATRVLESFLTDIEAAYQVVGEKELEAALKAASPAVQADIEAYARAKLGI